MRYIKWYSDNGIPQDFVFQYIISNLKDSLRTWDYFINWKKVHCNLDSIRLELNILNSLLGSRDFDDDFIILIKRYPEVIKTIPVLLAVREERISVLEDLDEGSFEQTDYDFSPKSFIDDGSANQILNFLKQTKLSDIFADNNVKNLVDYVMGIEVGLDSNGRKNRGGSKMEEVVGKLILKVIGNSTECQFISKASSSLIYSHFGKRVQFDKSDRVFDFAAYNKITDHLFLFETNFYNGGGSKLKSVCGEFKGLNSQLKKQKITLIWITDGLGWKTTERPLREAYDELDYLLNLKMLENGILDSILCEPN